MVFICEESLRTVSKVYDGKTRSDKSQVKAQRKNQALREKVVTIMGTETDNKGVHWFKVQPFKPTEGNTYYPDGIWIRSEHLQVHSEGCRTSIQTPNIPLGRPSPFGEFSSVHHHPPNFRSSVQFTENLKFISVHLPSPPVQFSSVQSQIFWR